MKGRKVIKKEKEKIALRIIQLLAIKGRTMAYEKEDYNHLAKLMDDLEYLPALMLEEKDRTKTFGDYLGGIEETFNYHGLQDMFDSGVVWGWKD